MKDKLKNLIEKLGIELLFTSGIAGANGAKIEDVYANGIMPFVRYYLLFHPEKVKTDSAGNHSLKPEVFKVYKEYQKEMRPVVKRLKQLLGSNASQVRVNRGGNVSGRLKLGDKLSHKANACVNTVVELKNEFFDSLVEYYSKPENTPFLWHTVETGPKGDKVKVVQFKPYCKAIALQILVRTYAFKLREQFPGRNVQDSDYIASLEKEIDNQKRDAQAYQEECHKLMQLSIGELKAMADTVCGFDEETIDSHGKGQKGKKSLVGAIVQNGEYRTKHDLPLAS